MALAGEKKEDHAGGFAKGNSTYTQENAHIRNTDTWTGMQVRYMLADDVTHSAPKQPL